MRATVGIALLVLAAGTLTACSPATLDESEMPRIMQLREDQLREQGEVAGIPDDAPIPDVVRWITEQDYAATMVSCVTEAGFEATLLGTQGIEYGEVDADRAAAFSLAMWTCRAQYSLDPRAGLPLTDAQFRMIYDHETTTMRDCLEDHGIFVDVAPNFAIYLERLRDEDEGWEAWSYVHLADIGQTAWEELEADCPRGSVPDGLYGPPLPLP